MSKRRSLFVALSGIFAAVMGVLWWRQRSVPSTAPAEIPSTEPPPSEIINSPAAPAYSISLRLVLVLRLLAAAGGLLCLTQMQTLLLASRLPYAPFALLVLGIALLLPLTANASATLVGDDAPTLEIFTVTAGNRRSRVLYFAATGFFVFVSLIVAQFGRITPLLLALWLLGTIAVMAATLTLRVDTNALKQWVARWQEYVPDLIGVGLGVLLLGALMRTTYAPETPLPSQTLDLQIMDALANGEIPAHYGNASPFYIFIENLIAGPTRELADLQRISGIFGLLLIPAAYVLGRAALGRWTGVYAAGFAAAGVWSLALAKSGTVYPALALCAALYVAMLFYRFPQAANEQGQHRFVFAGLLLGIGWLLAPEFGFMALLLPVRVLLGFLDARPAWWHTAVNGVHWLYRRPPLLRVLVFIATPLIVPLLFGYRWLRAQRRLPDSLLMLLVTAVVVLPFVRIAPDYRWLPIPNNSPDFQLLTGIPPLYAVLDALAYGLLSFNLTRDPSPLHGIINRPVFMPLLGALFLMGLLAWAWRVYRARHWREGWLLAALLVTLLPSALYLPLPLSYPDTWRTAVALPIAVGIAAYGAGVVAQSLQKMLGRIGIGLALALLVASLWLIAAEGREHYNTVALSAYEDAASLITQP